MKKIIAMISALAVVVGATVLSFAADFLGDANLDGKVDSLDALEILEYAVGITKEIDIKHADITKDGEINSLDALAVLQTAVGMLEPEAVEETTEPTEPSTEPATEPSTEPEKNPLDYSKAEIIGMYNKAVTDSYKAKVTVRSASNVSISINSITGGDTVKKLANSIIEKNAVPTDETKVFTDGKSSDGVNLKEFTACSNIDLDGVKSVSIKKNGNGYEIEFTVVSEEASLNKAPQYNSQCSKPLDINSVDLMGAKVTSADFDYEGTVIKAVIDENGKITSTNVSMPLAVIGEGKLSLIKIKVDAAGLYTNSSEFVY